MDNHESEVVKFTRNELYEKIWNTPTIKLAKDFGLSDVGLGKICKKHSIPKPPLGRSLRSRLPNKMALTSLPMYRRDVSENVVNQAIQILDENCVNGETDVKTQTHPRLLGL
jgi:hypothetical protein